MEDRLIDLLESFNYPVVRQGSLLPDEPYPTHFFTFWNDESYDANHYDDINTSGTVYAYSVNVYSVDPEKTYSLLRQAKELLVSNGWLASGDGYDVVSDENTHTGRGLSVLYRD